MMTLATKTAIKTFCAAWLMMLTGPALACACDIECKPGEIYSDEQEMCVEQPTA